MGGFMKSDDIFVDTFLNMLNLRFGPSMQDEEKEWFTGIAELAALQKEFEIFREGRSFARSVALLSTGGFYNPRAKARWYAYLETLRTMRSSEPETDGDTAIVRALLANLAAASPLPVHFTSHLAEGRDAARWSVLIAAPQRPLHYMAGDYLTISLPMRPRGGRSGGGGAPPSAAPDTPPPAPKRGGEARKATKKKKKDK
ncbi:hypothetical protein [Roseicella frigidaeris]|uniref:Uncharacterized protein n=1 Tax=Roseicella frigidaeris TaxID=2230885 RepID=A0A327MDW0_9PROT|nr:hypothetical protein [Roseicella frigidaeris]RAI58388.1 hypothetical protein DOO78_13610 [Roseicella frigidaeris]